KDKATGKEQSITITGSTRLSKEEIDRMVADAQRFAEEDRKAREAAETRNRADSLIYQTEKLLRDLGDKVPTDQKANIESAISELRSAMSSNDLNRIRQATDNLQQASYKLSEIMYQQAATGAATGGSEAGARQESTAGEEGVIDAEFKEQ
ncbi:MAG: Hsp70 family protein, partial [Armatimonadota bacterium]|nr:Hsp70 family protein [Armatimonadota bacterium]